MVSVYQLGFLPAHHLPADVEHPAPAPPRPAPASQPRRPSRHPGPGLHLDLPDAQVCLAARFRSGDVVPYTRMVEKHAAVGKFRVASRPVAAPPASWAAIKTLSSCRVKINAG